MNNTTMVLAAAAAIGAFSFGSPTAQALPGQCLPYIGCIPGPNVPVHPGAGGLPGLPSAGLPSAGLPGLPAPAIAAPALPVAPVPVAPIPVAPVVTGAGPGLTPGLPLPPAIPPAPVPVNLTPAIPANAIPSAICATPTCEIYGPPAPPKVAAVAAPAEAPSGTGYVGPHQASEGPPVVGAQAQPPGPGINPYGLPEQCAGVSAGVTLSGECGPNAVPVPESSGQPVSSSGIPVVDPCPALNSMVSSAITGGCNPNLGGSLPQSNGVTQVLNPQAVTQAGPGNYSVEGLAGGPQNAASPGTTNVVIPSGYDLRSGCNMSDTMAIADGSCLASTGNAGASVTSIPASNGSQPDYSGLLAPFGSSNPTMTLPSGVIPVAAPSDNGLPAYGAPGSPLQPIPNAEVPANAPGDAYAPNMPPDGPIMSQHEGPSTDGCGGALLAPCDNTPLPDGQQPSQAMTHCMGKGTPGFPSESDCNNLTLPDEYVTTHNSMNSALANGTCGYWFPMGNGGIQNPLCTPPCKMTVGSNNPNADSMLVDNPKLFKGQTCDSTGEFMLPGQPSVAR